MEPIGQFRSGTSGLVLTEPNKKAFPPPFQNKTRLEYYASKFNSIEINSSFYKIPRCKTYENWYALVPDNFQFTVKLWKGITHEKEYLERDIGTFMKAVDCLGNKKGCLLIQFPAKAVMSLNWFGKLLIAIRRWDPNTSWRIAVEFRHAQWYSREIYHVLNEFNAAIVLHDMPLSAPPDVNLMAPFVYLRFHGEKGDYKGSYDDQFLKRTAKSVGRWLQDGKDVYVYFNNTIGNAVGNLYSLNKMVEAL